MSLPHQIASKIKDIPMDPIALANNLELAYMLSFSPHQISHQSVQCSPRDTYHSSLSDLNFVDFDEKIYNHLYDETKKNYESKNSTVIKSIRNSFKQFFTRVSAMTYKAATSKDEKTDEGSSPTIKLPIYQEQFKIDQIKGNNPLEWPRNIVDFYNQIKKLPWNAFCNEPEHYFDNFLQVVQKSIMSMFTHSEKTDRKQFLTNLTYALEILLMITLKTNNQTFILERISNLKKLVIEKYLKPEEEAQIVSKLESIAEDILQKIPVIEEQEYHMPKKLWNKGQAFMIMKKIHFQKQNGLGYFSVTTDGTYLYVYVSAINGGMYKVGTGHNSSVAGKIYYEKQMFLPVGSKLEQINWVYLKGKLYLKSSCRDPFVLEVLNAQNFNVESTVELRCEGLFGHQSLINLNRNSILLADGDNLYFLGKQLRITQGKQQDQKNNNCELQSQKQANENKLRKKKRKKLGPPEQPNLNPLPKQPAAEKVLQFVLCTFDVDQKPKQPSCDQVLARQLYESFDFFFNFKECERALDHCNNDIALAAQWLAEQGEKERTVKILYPSENLIIAQSEITNNFNEKSIKGSNDLTTKDNSMLHIQNVNESLWTMDREEITCYSEVGVKIFSKNSSDSHYIENTQLETTHLKTNTEGQFSRNPQYSIIYDPYNSLFFVYTWPIEGGHYFPTAVLIGSDYKSSIELNFQKRSSVRNQCPKTIGQFSKWLVLSMNLLQNTQNSNEGRINDWLWYYGKKITEINQQVNNKADDSDKKKLSNKRSKILNKMNRFNEVQRIYQQEKLHFQKKGKVIKQIYFIPAFGPDGTLKNLKLIRQLFSPKLEGEEILSFIITFESWLTHSPNIILPEVSKYITSIRNQLIKNQKTVKLEVKKKMVKLFISNFYLFFPDTEAQQDFILTLDELELKMLIEKNYIMSKKNRKSIIYELTKKQLVIGKYDSKSKFDEKFQATSNLSINRKNQADSIGNLLLDQVIRNQNQKKFGLFVQKQQSSRNKQQFLDFILKSIHTGETGLKFFELLFIEAFKLLTTNLTSKQSLKPLEGLFLKGFKILDSAFSKANTTFAINLSETLLLILQLYFSSLCSFKPLPETIESLLKIIENLQRKQFKTLLEEIEESDFEGVSQTCEKVYETPHPLERGKNQTFPPFKNMSALLIFAEFDKRCQSDVNHDIMQIQLTHEGSPVGNSINCNDGVFSTSLRMTGKVDTKKPYLILGNSVTIDFSSSGHAKDAKSFGRYGFRFGLRPVFSGKIKPTQTLLAKSQKLFGSKASFQRFVSTIKLAVIVTSDAIEKLTYLEKNKNENISINKILKGKVFKEGYEEQVLTSNQKIEEQDIYSQFLEQQNLGDGRLIILQALHKNKKNEQSPQKASPIKQIEAKNKNKGGTEGEKKEEEIIVQKNKEKENWWNFEGIPAYIRTYLQKIKNFNGDFIDLFIEARKLAPPKLNFAMLLKSKGFTQQFKQLWLQGEALLFLTVLKHSGLLHLNLKFSIEYIKENLKAFEEARTGIFESFINKMQIVREWNILRQEFHREIQRQQLKEEQEKKEKAKSKPVVAVKRKGMATRNVNFDNRFSKKETERENEKKTEKNKEDMFKLKKKQAYRAIRQRLTQNYMIKSLCNLKKIQYVPDATYDNVTKIIEKIEKQQHSQKIQSVYVSPMRRLIQSCLFLLRIKSPSTQENLNEGQNIVPETVTRSLSSDNRHVNTNKVNLFREWLQNWKKWKDFKKEGKVELKFPVSEIVDFVNSWIQIDDFEKEINLRVQKTENRLKFYHFNNYLLKTTVNSFLSKYVVGAEVASIEGDYKSGLESVCSQKISHIESLFYNYQKLLQQEETKKIQGLPIKSIQFKQQIALDNDKFLDKLRLNFIHLYLISAQNKRVSLDLALFVIPFKYLTSTHQELTFISALIVQRAFMAQNSIQQILASLMREIGSNSLAAKRWKDYYFIQRVLFLLRKLEKKSKEKMEISQKRKIAQALFYLLYHLDIPIISRIALRIIKSLKIDLKNRIQTPFDMNYKLINFNDKGYGIQEFTMQNKKCFSNPELLVAKCSQLFGYSQPNPIKDKLLQTSKKMIEQQQQDGKQTYNIILNLHQEQQMVWLVQVLYYLEEIEKTIVPIKNWEEYLQKKNKKKEPKEPKQQKDNNNQNQPTNPEANKKKKITERIIDNFPQNMCQLSVQFENEMPVGWFLNYCKIFNEFVEQKERKQLKSAALPAQPLPGMNQKKNKNQQLNQNSGKKAWNPAEFIKIYKKFEQLTSKPLQEPKEDESIQNKEQFVRAKNFISRMRRHCAEASIIMSNFSQIGYYLFRENVSQETYHQICQLFMMGAENMLKQIPCEFTVKDYATKLKPQFIPPKKKSELKILCVKSSKYNEFHDLINAPVILLNRLENQSQFSYTNLNLSESVFEDQVMAPFSEFLRIDFAEEPEVQFGKQFIESNLVKMKVKHDQVILKDYPELNYFISQGGLESGMEQCTVVPSFNQHLTPQTSSLDKIIHKQVNQQFTDEPQEILEKCIDIMEKTFGQIKEKKDIMPYMLLTLYLKKACSLDMRFLPQQLVKSFGESLYKIAQGFKANKSIQAYQEQIQILLMRILDSENQNLSYFRLYRLEMNHVDHQIKDFIIATDKNKKQENKAAEKQTLATHQHKKSNYLLPVQPPIPEENNLLKYWEKNILPKIYDFVKTTLRPIEIQDFFEQIRIPLRIGDQTEAKKIAYVICDNKLPHGAVLPDANHNWNSLTIQELSVGMDVLVKLPKTRGQCSTPLLASNSQQYRLAQVVFIDCKNLSVLIKHRISEYGIFGYTWVPVNTLQTVEKSLAHYSRESIFEQMEESLKGMIYNYSKVCMTKLADKIQINKLELMNETIIDIFRDNPVSGWQENKQWQLKPVLKKMLKQNNLDILKTIEDTFCPYETYDINLFDEEIIDLNRFNKTLGLIVSFKKNSSIIWYSGIKFYTDPYGYKEIDDVYASKTCISNMEPLEFNQPNVYCKYYSNKSCLKAVEQGKYEQKQIPATICSVDPCWTTSLFLSSVITEIALQQNLYEDLLTRINKVFISWLAKRPPSVLASHICLMISKITRAQIKIMREKGSKILLESMGTTEQILNNLIEWINELVEEQQKEVIVLYSPLTQNLIECVATILSRLDKQPNLSNLPSFVKEKTKMIQMINEIEQNFKGKPIKTANMQNSAQFERFLVIENLPKYIAEEQFRKKLSEILEKNNGKILAPKFDIYYKNSSAVILVDSWDINELVEEEIMEKIQQEEEKQPQPEEGGLLQQWQCEICTFFNNPGNDSCEMCGSAAPPPKNQIQYEKVESTDVNKAEQKLREKQMKRFENIKKQIIELVDRYWNGECEKVDKQIEAQEKKRQQRRRKRSKKQQDAPLQFIKPEKPDIKLSSGSFALDSQVIEDFLKERFNALPQQMTQKVEGKTYLQKFKELTKQGYDFWGDHIANQSPSLLNIHYLSQLMEYIQDEICKGSSSVLSYSESCIRVLNSIPLLNMQNAEEPINFKAQNNMEVKIKYGSLANEKSYNIRYSWKIIKELNILVSKCMSFINMRLNKWDSKEIDERNSLGANLKYLRRLIMGAIKLQLFQKIMQKTSVSLQSHQIPKITIERLKIRQEKSRLKSGLISIKEKDDFMFTRAHQQIQKISSINLRSFKPKGTEPFLSFSVTLKGQDVMGEGGPYRQFFTDVSNELNPDEVGLGLFIKTPNNLHKIGESRQKWTINPKANTTYYLSLFKFLGILMGCCIRTGCHMNLDLCEFCWKVIADEEVKDGDIDDFDRQFYEQIKQIIDCPSQQIFQSLEEIVDQPVTWIYQSTDGQEKQLIPNGKNERVSYEDRYKYVDLMKKKRIEEIYLQIQHLRQGLGEMIPNDYFNQISGEELKISICGVPKVDVELLKKHTKYAGNLKEDSPVIKNFWEMMKELSEEQKLKLIRFCWGQERLPMNSEEFERNGIRFMIKPMMNCRTPDMSMPKADTCFFNIELPNYSSKEIMKEKILLAVNLDSTSINGDRAMRADDNPLMGNVDYDDDEEDEGEEYGGGGG